MATTFLGEIRMFGGNFAPSGWMFCHGQLLDTTIYSDLFTLIGTTYGGDGVNDFALPDLRGRAAIHQGQSAAGTTYTMGQSGGLETVVLTTSELPSHGYYADPSTRLTSDRPGTLAVGGAYAAPTKSGPVVGGSQPHENMSPFLVVSFIISLFGVYPTQ